MDVQVAGQPNERSTNMLLEAVEDTKVIRVSATSKPSSVAGAIAGMIREGKRELALQAIGKDAISQAVYALSLASLFLKAEGFEITSLVHTVPVELLQDTKVNGYRFDLIIRKIE